MDGHHLDIYSLILRRRKDLLNINSPYIGSRHLQCPSLRTIPTTTKTRRLIVTVLRSLLLTSTVLKRVWTPNSFVTNVSPRRVLKRHLPLLFSRTRNKSKSSFLVLFIHSYYHILKSGCDNYK